MADDHDALQRCAEAPEQEVGDVIHWLDEQARLSTIPGLSNQLALAADHLRNAVRAARAREAEVLDAIPGVVLVDRAIKLGALVKFRRQGTVEGYERTPDGGGDG